MQPATAAPEPDTDAGISATCWYEYGFYRVNSTAYASAFKDCVYLEEPQPLSFSVDALIGDWRGSYWVTWKRDAATSSSAGDQFTETSGDRIPHTQRCANLRARRSRRSPLRDADLSTEQFTQQRGR